MLIAKLRDVQHATSVVATQRLQDAYVLANYFFSAETQTLAPLTEIRPSNSIAPTSFLLLRDGGVYFLGGQQEFVNSPDPYVRKFLA